MRKISSVFKRVLQRSDSIGQLTSRLKITFRRVLGHSHVLVHYSNDEEALLLDRDERPQLVANFIAGGHELSLRLLGSPADAPSP